MLDAIIITQVIEPRIEVKTETKGLEVIIVGGSMWERTIKGKALEMPEEAGRARAGEMDWEGVEVRERRVRRECWPESWWKSWNK